MLIRLIPWCYGVTVGERYGQAKRFIAEIAKGKRDPRFIGLMALALSEAEDAVIPDELSPFVVKFNGTAEQRATLLRMLDEAREWWMTRMFTARLD
jgi:hypothetical protein